MVANIAQMLATAQIRSDERLVAVLPFFHIYGMQVLMNCGLRAGATVVTLPRFDLEQFLRVHQDWRDLGARAPGDEGLPEQPAGHGRDDRFRRVAAHR
jgi:hypothetical protein